MVTIHRYSRTQLCWKDFTQSFAVAEKVWVLDIYAAGEKPMEGITAQRLAAEIDGGRGEWVGVFATAKEMLTKDCKPGDVVVCFGAGDVNKFYDFI